jgi:uncharacterized membrane protein
MIRWEPAPLFRRFREGRVHKRPHRMRSLAYRMAYYHRRPREVHGNRRSSGLRHEGSPRVNLRLVSVAIALVVSAMLLGAGVYESVVLAPNLQGAPASLQHARGFYHATNPGMFFRWLVPTTQLLLLVAIVCNWRPAPGTRWRLGGALALLVLTDMITFRFHYPRNDILFVAPLTQPPAYYDHVVTEWAIGNYVRVALILIAVVLAMVSTIRIAREIAPGERRLS